MDEIKPWSLLDLCLSAVGKNGRGLTPKYLRGEQQASNVKHLKIFQKMVKKHCVFFGLQILRGTY